MLNLILFRLFAGIQNALYYSQLKFIARLWALVLIIFIFTIMPFPYSLSSAGVLFTLLAFEGKLWEGSIHFTEMIKTSLPIACGFISGWNMSDIVLSVYPGLILHKMVINLGSNKWSTLKEAWGILFSDITDDPTGKSFTFTWRLKDKWMVGWIHIFWFKVKGMADTRQYVFEQENPGWTKIMVPRQTMADRMIWAGISLILYYTTHVEFYFSDLINLL
jgi:hypothetical protein